MTKNYFLAFKFSLCMRNFVTLKQPSLELKYVRKSGFFETWQFSSLKSKIPKLHTYILNIQVQSSHIKIPYCEAIWSRIMFKNLNFSKFSVFYHCLKSKFAKSTKIVFQHSSLVSSYDIFLHCSNLETSYVQKSEFFKIRRFSHFPLL